VSLPPALLTTFSSLLLFPGPWIRSACKRTQPNRYTDPLHTASAERSHTTALHLLQSGAELNVIKSWLGHVSITTTSEYIEIDMAMKRKAIERCPPLAPNPEGEARWHANKDIQWLEDLRAPKSYAELASGDPADNPTYRHHDQKGDIAQLHIIPGST
jgi:hypothetical protein